MKKKHRLIKQDSLHQHELQSIHPIQGNLFKILKGK